MHLKLKFVFVGALLAALISCGSGNDSDDVLDDENGRGSDDGTARNPRLLPTAAPTVAPINTNQTGCSGSNTVCPNGGYNFPGMGSRPTLPPVNPLTPIGENCSTRLALTTSVGGATGTRSYLLGRIDPVCLTLSSKAELLLKTNNELTLSAALRCSKANGEFPVLCAATDMKPFVSTDGFVMVDVLLSPSAVYTLSGKFNVVR